MGTRRILYSCLLLIILLDGCVEPFAPPGIATDIRSLVVSGFLNSTDGSASIRLSRTIPLSDTEQAPAEGNASVSIEEENGSRFTLPEISTGTYSLSNMAINVAKRYRLLIKTSDQREYESDFVPVKIAPAIDSLAWVAENDGLEIQVNTHDDTDNTRYYLWTYQETWEYTAVYQSNVIVVNNEVAPRPLNADIYRCWSNASSQQILIASSDKLNKDIISRQRLSKLPKGSDKLFIRYSMLVKQRALTRDAYDYWLQLQKTNENLGGLFDPQPGSVVGNIHNVQDLSEPVLGYFTGGSVEEKRIFIKVSDLPPNLRSSLKAGECRYDTLAVNELYKLGSNELLGSITEGPITVGYYYTSKSCADCRSQGGVTTKPSFWP